MTAGFLGLGSVVGTSVMDDQWSGFDYPNNAQVVALLGDGVSTYNAVLQQSALTARQGSLRCTLETADALTVRGYFESRETFTFTDADESTTPVRVLDFTRSLRYAGLWDVSLVLIESDEPVETAGVGVPVTGLDTTLDADVLAGDTNVKVASVTTVTASEFVRLGPASPDETNSEVVRVLTVGTTGSGGTGLDIESDTGGGVTLAYASADEVKTVTGTTLAAPSTVGTRNLRVGSVTGLTIGTVVRVGYLGHYETRGLSFVGTALTGGTGISFTTPLRRAHSLDEWVVVVG